MGSKQTSDRNKGKSNRCMATDGIQRHIDGVTTKPATLQATDVIAASRKFATANLWNSYLPRAAARWISRPPCGYWGPARRHGFASADREPPRRLARCAVAVGTVGQRREESHCKQGHKDRVGGMAVLCGSAAYDPVRRLVQHHGRVGNRSEMCRFDR